MLKIFNGLIEIIIPYHILFHRNLILNLLFFITALRIILLYSSHINLINHNVLNKILSRAHKQHKNIFLSDNESEGAMSDQRKYVSVEENQLRMLLNFHTHTSLFSILPNAFYSHSRAAA